MTITFLSYAKTIFYQFFIVKVNKNLDINTSCCYFFKIHIAILIYCINVVKSGMGAEALWKELQRTSREQLIKMDRKISDDLKVSFNV